MKYSIKDFLSSKIALDVNEKDRPEFNRLMDEAEMKWACGHKASKHDWFPCVAENKVLRWSRGALPVVNFSDLLLHTPADFYAGRIGVRCDTREEYDALMRECEAKGLKWLTGPNPTQGPKDRPKAGIQIAVDPDSELQRIYFRCAGEKLDPPVTALPFRAIFPDPWAEFCAGKWMRVKPDQWPECARLLNAKGVKWCNDESVLKKAPSADDRDGDYYIGVEDCDGQKALVCDSGWTRNMRGAKCIDFSTLLPAPAKAPEPPAPYDGRGKHKVGDRFEAITGGLIYDVGDIVELSHDDGTPSPYFKRIADGKNLVIFWYKLKPIPAPSPRIEITVAGRVTTATLYEDGKAVRTGTAKCGPEDEFEFFTGATIAYNRVRFGQQFQPTKFAEFMALSKKIKALGAEIEKQVGKL